jgi:hypothetical protein
MRSLWFLRVTLARDCRSELTALAASLTTSFPLYFSISSEQTLIAFVRTETPWFCKVRNKTINKRKGDEFQEKEYNGKVKKDPTHIKILIAVC